MVSWHHNFEYEIKDYCSFLHEKGITRNKTFKLHKKQRLDEVLKLKGEGYFPMRQNDDLNIFFGYKYMNGKLYNRSLDSIIIPHSNMLEQICSDASMVQVGNWLWVIGGTFPCNPSKLILSCIILQSWKKYLFLLS